MGAQRAPKITKGGVKTLSLLLPCAFYLYLAIRVPLRKPLFIRALCVCDARSPFPSAPGMGTLQSRMH